MDGAGVAIIDDEPGATWRKTQQQGKGVWALEDCEASWEAQADHV